MKTQPTPQRQTLEPIDSRITSIQPGGGWCMRLELLWGVVRRAYLKRFRPGYVQKMRSLRIAQPQGCPHEVLDPRDLKYHRNLTGDCWAPQDDPFAWRNALPWARMGLAETVIYGGGAALAAAALVPLSRLAAALMLVGGLFVLWFFRNPKRRVPAERECVVAPADGRVVAVQRIEYDPYLDGPGILIGIFLSVLNVHVNRAPMAVRVVGLAYHPGKFFNALRPSAARENEQMVIRMEQNDWPYRRIVVRQIAGAIARRIVCQVRPGDELACGARLGMIKFGSRTELLLPADAGLKLEIQKGQHVKAGLTVVAHYETSAPFAAEDSGACTTTA